MNASEAAILALASRYGVSLPQGFREYLIEACPKDDFALDQKCTAWWPLERIKSVTDEYEHAICDPHIASLAPTSIFFADYMVWCGAWAIVCAPGMDFGHVFVIGETDRFVARSFAEFAALYVKDCGPLM